MEPVSLQNCLQQLNSLSYSPIIGNKPMSKDNSSQPSQIPLFSNQSKLYNLSAASVSNSVSSTKTPASKKRLFSDTSPPSPTGQENKAKHIKMKQEQLDATLDNFFMKLKKENDDQNEKNRKEIGKLSEKLTQTDKSITEKFVMLSGQIVDLQGKQKSETEARVKLQNEVGTLKSQVEDLASKIGSENVVDVQGAVDAILPLVTEALSETINGHTAEVKAYNSQAKATYFQSLVNEIKLQEKDVMLYGFSVQESADLHVEIKTKVFENIMDLGIDEFKAIKIGNARGDRPAPLKISFKSLEDKNDVIGNAFKLPRGMSMEKCLPRRYRTKNKEFFPYDFKKD